MQGSALILEAWTNQDGARAAADWFRQGAAHYRYLVVAGSLTGEHWTSRRWSSVDIVTAVLARQHLQGAVIIPAPTRDSDVDRTYLAALAAREALQRAGVHPRAVDVFTRGAHARRSHMVYEKVFGKEARIGIVCWQPPGFADHPWWDSSERALDFLKESVACLVEFLRGSRPRHAHEAPALDYSIETGP